MIIKWGKYKGQQWSEVPVDYIKWCLENIGDLGQGERSHLSTLLIQKTELTFSFDSLTKEQNVVGSLIERGENILLTGPAGSGKSYIIKNIRNAAIICPTGISAINAGGRTYHSTFQIIPGDPLFKLGVTKLYPRVIVLDEIFYVPPPLLDSILKNVIGIKGKQIIMTGDPYQLAPIMAKLDPADEEEYSPEELVMINAILESKETVYDVLERHGIEYVKCELQRSERHRTDKQFSQALTSIRTGSPTKTQLELINMRVDDPTDDALILCFRKAIAKGYNDSYIGTFDEVREYKPVFLEKDNYAHKDKEWYIKLSKKMERPPAQLTLAIGCNVVLTYNDPDKHFVNGDLGVVVTLNTDTVTIRLLRNNALITLSQTQLVKGKEYLGWLNFGLLVAKAMTIHKSQGCTISGNVHLEIDPHLAKCWRGAIYTAISRVRTLDQLSLSGRISKAHISQSKNKNVL